MDRTREGRASQRDGFRARPGRSNRCGSKGRRHFISGSPLVRFLLLLLVLPPGLAAQIQPIELEGIIVTGTPVHRLAGTESSHVTILEGEKLRARGIAGVPDALAEVPGLVVVRNGSYGSVTSTFFRGAESDHVKVLVDGVEVNQPGGSFDFSGLQVAEVERIEVARGPASALYGSDAVAGVINIITRRGRGAPTGSLTFRGGSYGRQDWSGGLQGGGESTSYSLTASHQFSEGILDFNNRSENTTVSGSVFLTPDDRTRIGVVGRYGDRVYHYPTDGSGKVVDENAFSYGNEMSLSFEAARRMTDRVAFRAVVRRYGWDGGSDDQSDGPSDLSGYYGYVSQDTFDRTSVEMRADLSLTPRETLSVGAEVEEEELRSFSESLSEFGSSPSRGRSSRSDKGYYAHLASSRGGFSVSAGARLEDNEQYGDFFTYQAGVSYSLAGTRTRVRGNVGKGMKAPTFSEITTSAFTVGNPELDPEESQVWEVGMEQEVGRGGGRLSLTWFDQELQDLIQYTFSPPTAGGPNYYNVAEARSKGLEVAGTLPLGPVTLSGGYTYLDTEVLDSGFDEGEGATFVEGEPLIRRPEHQASLRGAYGFARGSVHAGARIVGSRQDRDFAAWPAAPVELDGYTLVDVGGEFTLLHPRGSRPGFRLLVRGENLLDEDYQEVFGYRAPGRAVLVGGCLTFGG